MKSLLVVVAALVVAGPQAGGPARGTMRQVDSLGVVARRAASAWQRHDFEAMVAGSPGVMVRLGGAEPMVPMRPSQAAEMLRAFTGGASEVAAEVHTVRQVDESTAFGEVLRTFSTIGTEARRAQTLYFGWRRVGGVFRLVEVRLLP